MLLEHFFQNAWRWKLGLPEVENNPVPDFHLLQKSEWSQDFENHMRARLIQGAFRYGLMGSKDKPKFDRMESILKRVKKYNETGNIEFLVDIANLALLEYVEGDHPKKHFKSIDDGEHVGT